MEFWGITDTGKVRQNNQDAYIAELSMTGKLAILVVCDGMGGARAGNVASSIASEVFVSRMLDLVRDVPEDSEFAAELTQATGDANQAVYREGISNPDCAGMGTTLVAAVVNGTEASIANIGDSRAYHIDSDSIKQITRDHSVVEDMVSRGDITRLEARTHPNKNLITRALGSSRAEPPDLFNIELKEGEYLLLCSDGLSNMMTDEEMLGLVRSSESVEHACTELVALANRRGSPDNVTALLLRNSAAAPSAMEV